MKTYSVKILNTGKITVDKSILTRGTGCAEKITVPVRSLAVEGNGLKLIVDTGLPEKMTEYPVIEGAEIHVPEKPETMEAALEEIGWKAEDVDIVINTHLHFITCGNNALFKNAQVFVQRKEWEYAHHPSQNQTSFYISSLLNNSAQSGVRMELIEGEYEIAEGLILLPTPGHSRGHQSVLINTAEGVVCYAGHSVNLLENLNDNIIGNILDDTRESFMSMEMVKRTSRYIIPGFDPQIKAFSSNGFPETHNCKKNS